MTASAKNKPDKSDKNQDTIIMVEQLQAQLTEAQTEIEVLQHKLVAAQEAKIRALADYQNLQRRTQDERHQMAKMATQDLVADLLDHFDHLSMAVEHSQDKGLELIVTQLWQTLAEHGLEEIVAVGKPFNPELMEAVETGGDSHGNDGVVEKVVQRGYLLNGVVVRVAKVIVAA